MAAHPDKIAVVYEGQQLTYQALYEQSHALAVYLQAQGVKPDSLVGLCVDRTPEMMVGLLGILMAGAAYVPLDPKLPDERIRYMLSDSDTGLVLTSHAFSQRLKVLSDESVELLALDTQWTEVVSFVEHNNVGELVLNREVNASNLAYVIYTSGSTGTPKGVMVEHYMVVDYAYSVYKKMELTDCESFIALSTFSADLGNTALFIPIIFAKSLHLVSNEMVFAPDKFKQYVDQHRIDCIKMTPSHFEMFKLSEHEMIIANKVQIFAGEPLPQSIVKAVKRLNPLCRVYNNYGPTETSIAKLSTSNLAATTSLDIHLGKALNNTQLYVLDKANNLVPTGVPGELFIAGDGVARGYMNRADLTAEKFLNNPFHQLFLWQGKRMYRTGDLVRWRVDGNIEYLGRIDSQINIRGFRIEVGEIETCLNLHLDIKDCAVIAYGNEENKKLVAFYTVNDTKVLNNEELQAYLNQSLPEYML
ncbi:non-ribosomal peptide synthetase, partial [Pseudoalteromonas sp. BMB]|uniref:non-ribosomal peptide synthetase n=1 Tax=Pseudoalteromonas sp. BMB TaxID=1874619 RepID=UPI0020C8147A